jgi:signal transduction histidine kinase
MEPISINVNRLHGFAEDVLTISTIEAGQSTLSLKPVEMAPLLHRIADEFARQARQKHLIFQTNIATSSWVNLSTPQFRSALWNLLDNAYKFTPEGGSIALIARDDGNLMEVSVRDTGTGIAATEVPRLFTKFHRGTDTLTYDYEGVGIGLYISKLIIEQHGGKISVQSAEGAGSTFTITLARTHPAEQATSSSPQHLNKP